MLRTLLVALSLALLIAKIIYAGDINEVLIDAAANGDIAQVKNLLAKGVDVHAGGAAVLMAIMTGHTDVVKVLLANTEIGTAVLLANAVEGKTDTIRVLLANGADVKAR